MTGKRKLAAILSADVVGYSRLMGDDERATVDTLHAYRQLIRERVERHDGRVVDAPGDALLAEFPSAIEAMDCAREIQYDLAKRNAQLAEHRCMFFRIGINLGDVIEENGALYGDGVNIAARLEALAKPGGVCVSGSVYDQIEGKLSIAFKFAGEQAVKNIAKPVRAYHALLDSVGNQKIHRSRPRAARMGVIAVLLASLAALLGTVLWQTGAQKAKIAARDETLLAMPTGPAIAVLPFTNMSGDSQDEYFSDGLTEDIITELSRFHDLHVLARNTTFQYKGQAVDVRALGKKLGAAYILVDCNS